MDSPIAAAAAALLSDLTVTSFTLRAAAAVSLEAPPPRRRPVQPHRRPGLNQPGRKRSTQWMQSEVARLRALRHKLVHLIEADEMRREAKDEAATALLALQRAREVCEAKVHRAMEHASEAVEYAAARREKRHREIDFESKKKRAALKAWLRGRVHRSGRSFEQAFDAFLGAASPGSSMLEEYGK